MQVETTVLSQSPLPVYLDRNHMGILEQDRGGERVAGHVNLDILLQLHLENRPADCI